MKLNGNWWHGSVHKQCFYFFHAVDIFYEIDFDVLLLSSFHLEDNYYHTTGDNSWTTILYRMKCQNGEKYPHHNMLCFVLTDVMLIAHLIAPRNPLSFSLISAVRIVNWMHNKYVLIKSRNYLSKHYSTSSCTRLVFKYGMSGSFVATKITLVLKS